MMGSATIHDRYTSRVGERVGHMTFTALSARRYDGSRLLGVFSCDCGSIVELPLGRVLNGQKRFHCGCETDRGKSRTHGMRNSPEYSSWMSMKARCLYPTNKDYPRWGGKGITVYPKWAESFEAFFAHIGPRPYGTSLDRINNTKGYEPGNVRWASGNEQAANRSDTWFVEIGGVTYNSCEEAARAHSVSSTTIYRWCRGFHDNRRAHQNNTGFTPAKPGCRMWRKYAS